MSKRRYESDFSDDERPARKQAQVYKFDIRWSWCADYGTQEEFREKRPDLEASFKTLMGKKGGYAFALESTARDLDSKESKGGDNLHYQCYLHVSDKRRPHTLGGQLGMEYPGIRVAPVSINGIESFKKYVVKKDHTLVDGPWTSKPQEADLELKAPTKSLPWQRAVVKAIKESVEKRSIHWLYDPIGHSGKSDLITYLEVNNLAETLGFDTATNLRNMIVKSGAKRAYFFDLVRTKDKGMDMNSIYCLLEELSNGIVRSGKYEGTKLKMTPPHLWVFSNYPPESGKLTGDRIKLYKIHENTFDLMPPPPPNQDFVLRHQCLVNSLSDGWDDPPEQARVVRDPYVVDLVS